jgi:hypothetical protein
LRRPRPGIVSVDRKPRASSGETRFSEFPSLHLRLHPAPLEAIFHDEAVEPPGFGDASLGATVLWKRLRVVGCEPALTKSSTHAEALNLEAVNKGMKSSYTKSGP